MQTGSYLLWRKTLYSLQTVWIIGDTYLISPVIASLPGCFWQAEGETLHFSITEQTVCSAPPLNSHAFTRLQSSNSVPDVILFPSLAWPLKKPRGVLTNSHRQRGVFYTRGKGPHVSTRALWLLQLYEVLAFPLPFEHYSTEKLDPRQQPPQWGFSRELLGMKQRGRLVWTS